MKLSFLSLVAALLSFGCASRTPMDCSPGTADCECNIYGSCQAGLMCVDGWCESSSAPVSTGGAYAGGTGGSGSGGWATITLGTGGSIAQAGSGGIRGTGGITYASTYPGTGGFRGLGGDSSRPTGGALGVGGRPGVGGSPNLGGRPGVGGSPGTGGRGACGASGSPGRSGNRVDFTDGKAQGLMSGYGWVALGSLDTVTQPTCAGSPITSSGCSADIRWPTTSGLCITGVLPAVSTSSDYVANWGVMVSANVTEPAGGTLGPSTFQTVSFAFSNAPTSSPVRGLLHRAGDPADVNYCATIQNNQAMTVTAFNTQCWDGTGVPFVLADLAAVDWVGIQIPSAATAIRFGNFCLNAVTFK